MENTDEGDDADVVWSVPFSESRRLRRSAGIHVVQICFQLSAVSRVSLIVKRVEPNFQPHIVSHIAGHTAIVCILGLWCTCDLSFSMKYIETFCVVSSCEVVV